MNINPIRAEAHYKATLDEVSSLMEGDPDVGTPEGDRLDVLVTLVQAYEGKHYPIDPPADPLGRSARLRGPDRGQWAPDQTSRR